MANRSGESPPITNPCGPLVRSCDGRLSFNFRTKHESSISQAGIKELNRAAIKFPVYINARIQDAEKSRGRDGGKGGKKPVVLGNPCKRRGMYADKKIQL